MSNSARDLHRPMVISDLFGYRIVANGSKIFIEHDEVIELLKAFLLKLPPDQRRQLITELGDDYAPLD